MATLAVQNLATASTITMSAADVAGDEFVNDGRAALMVVNASVSEVTVTFDCPNACNFGVTNAAHDMAVAVPAGTTKLIKATDKGRFNNNSTGRVSAAYSAVTDVTVAAIVLR